MLCRRWADLIDAPGACWIGRRTSRKERVMAGPRKTLVAPILVITVGVAWLLMTLQVIAPVNWVWTMGLAVAGIVTLVGSGVDRLTIVVGPLLILASLASVLRQTGRLSIEHEVPCLVIAMGVLMLIGRALSVPSPKWLKEPAGA
jgi:hypothetical protein